MVITETEKRIFNFYISLSQKISWKILEFLLAAHISDLRGSWGRPGTGILGPWSKNTERGTHTVHLNIWVKNLLREHSAVNPNLEERAVVMTWRWRGEFGILRFAGVSWPWVEKQSLAWVLAVVFLPTPLGRILGPGRLNMGWEEWYTGSGRETHKRDVAKQVGGRGWGGVLLTSWSSGRAGRTLPLVAPKGKEIHGYCHKGRASHPGHD